MDCPLRSGHDLAEAYVAGTLPEAEQDAYEQHFFGCSACLAQVQTLQELADRLRQLPAPAVLHRTAAPGWTAAPWLGLALAAGLVAAFGWWWQGGVNRAPDAPPIATGPATASTPTANPTPGPTSPAVPPDTPTATPPVEAASRRAVLTQLALVVPPRYVALAVRGGQAPPAGSFDAAMANYVAGRHRDAAAGLRALSEATPADPGVSFFLGISELVLGHPAAARESLTRAIAADVQPYADEAHFYLAKAYLAEDAVDKARTELRYAAKHEAGPEGEAQRLLSELDRLPR
jgi:tetratricopeptide (TPR) repeat protein